MPDYSRGKIYKIFKKDEPTLCYVGSTAQTLNERLRGHRKDSKTRASLIYLTIDGKWDEWEMELIENFPCNSLDELEERETRYRLEIGTLNMRIETRTWEQYCEDKKEDRAKLNKEWREKNQKWIEEYKDQNKEKIAKVAKEYREKNKIILAQKDKEYREKNKEKITQQRRERYALKKLEKLKLQN